MRKFKRVDFIALIIYSFVILVIILGISKCFISSSSGYVKDAETNRPLSDVEVTCDVHKINSSGRLWNFFSRHGYSDKTGYFIVSPHETVRHYIFYTGITKMLTFEKPGYLMKSVCEDNIEDDTVLLEKRRKKINISKVSKLNLKKFSELVMNKEGILYDKNDRLFSGKILNKYQEKRKTIYDIIPITLGKVNGSWQVFNSKGELFGTGDFKKGYGIIQYYNLKTNKKIKIDRYINNLLLKISKNNIGDRIKTYYYINGEKKRKYLIKKGFN